MTKIATTRIGRNKEWVGWKVYLDGKKYPTKPLNIYVGMTEEQAIRQAFLDAGHDPIEIVSMLLRCDK